MPTISALPLFFTRSFDRKSRFFDLVTNTIFII